MWLKEGINLVSYLGEINPYVKLSFAFQDWILFRSPDPGSDCDQTFSYVLYEEGKCLLNQICMRTN